MSFSGITDQIEYSYTYPDVPRPKEIPLAGSTAQWHEFILLWDRAAYRSPLASMEMWQAHYRGNTDAPEPIKVYDWTEPFKYDTGPIPAPPEDFAPDAIDFESMPPLF